jgi:hypothetical protein
VSEKLVKFKILEPKGFSIHEAPATKAIEDIRAYIQKNGGWFYLDKVVTNIDTTTPADLENASVIAVTNIIIGGMTQGQIHIIWSEDCAV